MSHVNTLRGHSFSQLDARVAKAFKFGGRFGVELIGEVFNLLNEKNAVGFRGNRFVGVDANGKPIANAAYRTPSAFAGDPGHGDQRLAQLGLRLNF